MVTESTELGGTSISASLADCQQQITQMLGLGTNTNTDYISNFSSAYKLSGGGPILKQLGYNPFEIFTSGAFHLLYWGLITIILSIVCIIALSRILNSRSSASAKHPLGQISTVYFRLLIGVLIIGNTPLVYALLMTFNTVLSEGVRIISSSKINGIIQSSNLGTLTFAQARIDSIRSATSRRVIALYPSDITKLEMLEIANFYNSTIQSLKALPNPSRSVLSLQVIDTSSLLDIKEDSRVISFIGRILLQNFNILIASLGSVDQNLKSIQIAYPSGHTSNLPLLSSALSIDDSTATLAISGSYSGNSNLNFENARQIYAKAIFLDTLQYLDSTILPIIRSSPTLSQRLSLWFSEKVEQAAASAINYMTAWRSIIDWIARSIGIVFTRFVSFIITLGVSVLIEVELFVLVLTIPLWLIASTEEAFYGVLRSLISLSVFVPAYQFIMLFVDSLMGLILRYILLGSVLTNSVNSSAGDIISSSGIIAIIGSNGELIALVMTCYIIIYLFLAVFIALKTPKLLTTFIKGAGLSGMFLSTFITGLIAGASSAITTASVAGGNNSIANKFLTSGSRMFQNTIKPSFTKPSIGKVSSMSLNKSSKSIREDFSSNNDINLKNHFYKVNYKAAVKFGAKTFVENLSSDAPLDGLTTSLKALDIFNKQASKDTGPKSNLKQKDGVI
jgi:hypothetical protein